MRNQAQKGGERGESLQRQIVSEAEEYKRKGVITCEGAKHGVSVTAYRDTGTEQTLVFPTGHANLAGEKVWVEGVEFYTEAPLAKEVEG